MPNIKIDISDNGVTAALNRLLAAGEDLNPVLNALGRQLKTNVQLGFEAGRDPYGNGWKPLKVRKGKPLLDSGVLMNSIDYQVEGNAVEVGTNKEYGPMQQFGGTVEPKTAKALRFFVDGHPVFVGRVTIPPRPFLPTNGLPDTWREEVLDVIGDFLRRAALGNG